LREHLVEREDRDQAFLQLAQACQIFVLSGWKPEMRPGA
jgi:hypothetical protein